VVPARATEELAAIAMVGRIAIAAKSFVNEPLDISPPMLSLSEV